MRLIQYAKMSTMLIGVVLGLASSPANAIWFEWNTSGSVSSSVTQSGANTWIYQFTLSNTTVGLPTSIYQFSIPYFSDAGITNITSPSGWSSQVVIADPEYDFSHYGFSSATSKALQWEIPYWQGGFNLVSNGGSLSGFGFTSSFSPVKGPYYLGLVNGAAVLGDPAIPGSPSAIAAGYTAPFQVASVPEPETYAMLMAGLGLMGFVARRRKQSQA